MYLYSVINVIHNTESTTCITYRNATRGGPCHEVTSLQTGEDSTCNSGDMLADKLTNTQTEHAHYSTALYYCRWSNVDASTND